MATACIGDVAVLAGATTLEGTLAVAETTSEIAVTVGTYAGYVGTVAGVADALHECPGEWLSAQCGFAVAGIVLDGSSRVGDSFISEWSIWKPIYATLTSEAGLLYSEITDRLTASRCD